VSSNVSLIEPPQVRVYLPTFRRPQMLRRAVASLRAQTWPRWRCTLINDAPDDPGPQQLFHTIGDVRFDYECTPARRGPVAVFNRIFSPITEPYLALHEDDNWWEPNFLQTLVAALEARPNLTVAWCNQRVWAEQADGTWQDTHRTVNPFEPGQSPRLIAWGQEKQALGALHSNGAMLLRMRPNDCYATPADLPFSGVESVRERQFPHPLLYLPEPLAHFAVTRQTAQSRDRQPWAELQTALAMTFVRHAPDSAQTAQRIWSWARQLRPAPLSPLLLAALADRGSRALLRPANFRDWSRLALATLRRPAVTLAALRVRRRRPHWWQLLDAHTAARFAA
jgi:hypothetical protein